MVKQVITFSTRLSCVLLGLALNSCSFKIADTCLPQIASRSEISFAISLSSSDCTIDEQTYQQLIHTWMNERAANASKLNGFYLGRIIKYPWISQHLASAALHSPDWDAEAGTSHNTHPYGLVESFLVQEDFRQRLDAPFKNTPYTIGSVSVEKVLIQDASLVLQEQEQGAGQVPFDALLWVDLVER